VSTGRAGYMAVADELRAEVLDATELRASLKAFLG
jgi:hypothetical protein